MPRRLVLCVALAFAAPAAAEPWSDAFACAAAMDTFADIAARVPILAANAQDPQAAQTFTRAAAAAAPALARARLAGQAAAEGALQVGYPAWADARRAAGHASPSVDHLRADARAEATERVRAITAAAYASRDSGALVRFVTELDCMERMRPELDRLPLD